ncbi:phospho-N-acetylmuramoyl-pentapeptide-transferase [Balneicella halophila]|uniref:Phospho-N-acetylmuramoyl-pentapeptide-transferase n=1 Tax=Balneicella halophila TaxID=1537566 RepID=A0A7L4UP29_BALHA|nr:phospho-N-acetylmuramoyl-pentapeptide-transferase [Balneicella halophila]PVX50940.1 phospho-N-acetylmuramoyl-pentapeptide-transferase [Balneicella halophila]
MLYYLFRYLNELDVPGAGMFDYISFRAAMALLFALMIGTLFGKKIIRMLQRQQIGEEIRDLGLEGQMQKKGTPTMGGLIIVLSILIPVLLFTKLDNIYIILMVITTVWLGALGFLDDYIKVVRKDKSGLSGKFKVVGQIGLGLIVGLTFFMSNDIVVREQLPTEIQSSVGKSSQTTTIDVKSTKTTIPFVKNNELDYSKIVSFAGEYQEILTWILFVFIVIFIVTAVSNGANMTDGLDGLATGSSAIIGSTLLVFAYVSGNFIYANYLNIMFIPHTGELVVFMAAFVGAMIGFLWYNAYPAQVFMGDTGSLTIGGIIAVFAIMIRKELLIPILCGIFLIENLSVIMQVSYFKYTKKKFGEGRRIFKMSPLHHHFQVQGFPEPKIVTRFWIVGIFLAVLTVITLKMR